MRDWGKDCFCLPGRDDTFGRRFKQKCGTLPFGYDHKYIFSEFGYNLKATEMQAAIGCAQLEKLPSFIRKRKENFTALYMGLEETKDVFILPEAAPGSEPSWFGFIMTVKARAGFSRNEIVRFLEDNLIQTRLLFGGNLIRQPCFDTMRKKKKGFRAIGNLRNTDRVMRDTFWIGVYPGITQRMIQVMVDKINVFLQRKRHKE
jgi:CDP-6-deoxy-D-xylo-4-hexulose-3-dehydrase